MVAYGMATPRRCFFDLFAGFYDRFSGFGFGLGLHNGLHRLLRRLLQPERVDLDGYHLYLDPSDQVVSYHIAADRVWEPFQTQVFQSLLKPGMVVLDIGAHIGYYTLMASKAVGPAGRVYCFEPDANNLALLRRNVQSNGCGNVIVVPKAVSDRAGMVKLHLDPLNKGSHSVTQFEGSQEGSLEIETLALDGWLSEQGVAPALIKMDIEGSEWAALRGMKSFLDRRGALSLVMELLPHRLSVEPGVPLKFLAERGFGFSIIDENAKALSPATEPEILARLSCGGLLNVLCQRP